MAHRLRTLFIAMMAVGAVSAIVASAAYAVPEFHSHETLTTLKLTHDGTEGTKTAHQVLDAGANGAITCKGLHATATTSAKTVTQVTIENIEYTNCNFFGIEPVFVKMNGCHYLFTSHGGGLKLSMETGTMHVQCPVGKVIEFGIPSCVITISAQTPTGPTNQITFHNEGLTANNTTAITAEPTVEGIHYHATGAGCVQQGAGQGNYTTGNATVTGFKHNTATQIPIWWA